MILPITSTLNTVIKVLSAFEYCELHFVLRLAVRCLKRVLKVVLVCFNRSKSSTAFSRWWILNA